MKVYCPDCGKGRDGGPAASGVGVCAICQARRVDRIRRLGSAEVGRQSCPESYELGEDVVGGDHFAQRLVPGGNSNRGRLITHTPAPY